MVNKLFDKIRLTAFACIAVMGLLIIIDVPAYFRVSLYTEQYLGIYLSLILFGTYISVPYKKDAGFTFIDLILALLSFAAGLYITIMYPQISLTMGVPSLDRTIFGLIAIVLIIEALRRSMGISLTIICCVFLLYTRFSSNLTGILHGRPFTLEKMINYIYIDPNSLFFMLSFGATVGVAFIFFGQVLLHYGGGKSFIDFALLFCGKTKGGSAKTAVVASSLVGTITGAPMSNVLLTGSITIPMMKEAGYPPHFAAAVEAVASSGGQIMPPVMGIAAFIIAETLGVPYSEIALAALIPALLFYFAILIQVHMDAGKFNLKTIPVDQLPKPKDALRNGWFVIPPIIVLLVCMFALALPPAMSAIIASITGLPFLAIKKENQKNFIKNFIGALEESGELMVGIGIVMAAAGLIVGCINASGLAFNMSLALIQLGKTNILLLLICAAIASLVLGMGMPSVAAYALVAILVAPSLIKFGVTPMAAHLFVFYFSVISNITPPVAVSCFAAAPLAGANPTKVGFTAFRLAIASYIVPFVFCFDPILLLIGKPLDIAISVLFVTLAIFGLCIALTGFWMKTVSISRRFLIIIFATIILWPNSITTNICGSFALFILLYPDFKLWIAQRKQLYSKA